jgi:hypothetical protein
VVIYTFNPSYSGWGGRKIKSSRSAQAKLEKYYLKTKYNKRARGMA